MPGLGRRFAPDPRDANFPMRAALPTAPSTRTYRYWNANGWWGNQLDTPQCVAYAWAHWLEDGPVPQSGVAPILHPQGIYEEAQLVDEWPGEDYDGTSVRAGAKVLKNAGFVSEYRWATKLEEVVAALLDVGPVVVGFNWYEDMFTPDEAGLIHLGGALVGGHGFVLDGISTPHKLFRMKNSWGRDWGHDGFAYLAFEDVDHLLHEDGEACLAVEVRH
jgi:hypothetical protein